MPTDELPYEMPANKSRLSGWRWLAFYCVISTVINWRLVGSLTTHISYGHEEHITVPLLNLWTVWWNADRVTHGFRGYWNSPIFFPTQKTFVFSEAQPASMIVAPIVWLTDNRGLAYNIYQLLIIALNGFSAHQLLRRLGHIRWLALCGGFMSQILPFVIWQLGVVQLTTLFGIHWTLHALLDLFGTGKDQITSVHSDQANHDSESPVEAKSKRVDSQFMTGIRLGLAYGLTYWLCNYWGLFQTLLLLPCSLFLWNRRLFRPLFWQNVALAGLIAVAMIGPFAWLQRSLSHEHNWQTERTQDLIHGLSAHVRDHADTPWITMTPWLEFPEADRDNVWPLGGGGLKLLLVPFGFVVALLTPRRRQWGLFVLVFGLMAFGLSLGPTIRIAAEVPFIGTVCPYEFLQKYVPGFSLIRSPFRFAMFVQLAAVWLSVEALDLLNSKRWFSTDLTLRESTSWRRLMFIQRLFDNKPGERLCLRLWIPLILASTLTSLEAVPPPPRLYELPSRGGLPVWVTWLRDNADSNAGVACLPFPFGYQVTDYEETTLWMYWGTFHGRPLLNGYSGFFPHSYNQLRDGLAEFERPPRNPAASDNNAPQFSRYGPENPGLKRLNESDARYVVMKRSFGTRDDVWNQPQTRFRWAHVASDEIEKIDIYELPKRDTD
jgi:hypothetical protein